MATKPEIPQEEIDLGTLFGQIGKMFSNFFAFFGNIFKSIYHFCIIFLLFLRKNIIVLGIATLLGAIVGYILSLNQKPVFTAEMTVEANYGVASQLYKQIDVINDLVANKDTTEIARLFDIPISETSWLSGFSMEPIEPEKQRLKAYDAYMQETDTIYTREFEFNDYQQRLDDKDLSFFKIQANSIEPDNFKIYTNGLIKMAKTDYYINRKNKKLGELTFAQEEIRDNIYQLDSLRKRYNEVALIHAKKEGKDPSNLNFSTSNAVQRNFDMELNSHSLNLLEELDKINKKIERHDRIIEVSSDFGNAVKNTSLLIKGWFKYAVLGFILALLVLSGINFNRYLSNYENKVLEK